MRVDSPSPDPGLRSYVARLGKRRWHVKSEAAALHLICPVGYPPTAPLRDYFGDGFDHTVFFLRDGRETWLWDSVSVDRLLAALLTRVEADGGFLEKLRGDWQRECHRLRSAFLAVEAVSLASCSERDLRALQRGVLDTYMAEYALSMGLQEAFAFGAQAIMTERLRGAIRGASGVNESDLDALVAACLSPKSASFLTLERAQIRAYAALLQNHVGLEVLRRLTVEDCLSIIRRHSVISGLIEDHARRYYWIENTYARVRVVPFEEFAARVAAEAREECRRPETLAGEKRGSMQVHQKRVAERLLDGSPEVRQLLDVYHVFADMHDSRKAMVLRANHYLYKLLQEASRRAAVAIEDALWSTPYEYSQLLNGELAETLVERRGAPLLCIHRDRSYLVIAGQEATELFEGLMDVEDPDADAGVGLQGMGVSPGIVSGEVRVVLGFDDVPKVGHGDIVVASMTRPEMIVAVEKAAGIVTDEGGLTCHAAVIAREFGVPCITGTQVATRVLEDGMRIEMNGKTGTIDVLA